MPIYEYTCRKCGADFERVEAVSDHGHKKVRCPACKSTRIERRWSLVHAVTSKKS